MDTGERRNTLSNTGVHRGDALGPALFCMRVGTILRKFRTRFEPKGAEAGARTDDIAISSIAINLHMAQALTLTCNRWV